ncbi:MAG: DUF6153 family protein [Actinomycetota bacterium]|nr:DUF6153 family protein [Actinomycetota bacterium]MDQ3717258.1 DUF6153 family protein [Actinomycetota bacterium]
MTYLRCFRGPAPVVRLALGALALLGLFAMHGLGGHGTMHRTASDASSAKLQAQLHGDTVDSSSASMAAPDHGEAGSHPDGGDGALVGLCLAVLAIALLGMHCLRSEARWQWAGCRVVRLRAVLPFAVYRDRDPPDPLALSILRC